MKVESTVLDVLLRAYSCLTGLVAAVKVSLSEVISIISSLVSIVITVLIELLGSYCVGAVCSADSVLAVDIIFVPMSSSHAVVALDLVLVVDVAFVPAPVSSSLSLSLTSTENVHSTVSSQSHISFSTSNNNPSPHSYNKLLTRGAGEELPMSVM